METVMVLRGGSGKWIKTSDNLKLACGHVPTGADFAAVCARQIIRISEGGPMSRSIRLGGGGLWEISVPDGTLDRLITQAKTLAMKDADAYTSFQLEGVVDLTTEGWVWKGSERSGQKTSYQMERDGEVVYFRLVADWGKWGDEGKWITASSLCYGTPWHPYQ